jgi:hypothetical protein
MIVLITDGETVDQDLTEQTLRSRNAVDNPLVVVACTNDELNWVRKISNENGTAVTMLNDFHQEMMNFLVVHGPSIEYTEQTYQLMHVIPAPMNRDKPEGLQFYGVLNKEFTQAHLTDILGYTAVDAIYKHYINTSPLAQYSRTGVMMDKPALSSFVGYNIDQKTYQFYLRACAAAPKATVSNATAAPSWGGNPPPYVPASSSPSAPANNNNNPTSRGWW